MKIKRVMKTIPYKFTLVLLYLLFSITPTIVHADTDGNELKTTNQPDKLVIQLGADLANAEFELKLDSGVFPVPVIANSSGVLTMELGGSKTYTLTRLLPAAPPIVLTQPDDSQQQQKTENPEREDDPIMNAPSERTAGVPLVYLFVFLGGLGVIAGGLVISKIIKKRREYYYGGGQDEYDDYDE